MRLMSMLRYGAAALALGGLGLFTLSSATPAEGQSNFVQDGRAGFIVTNIRYALAPDASETGACPQGMSRGPRDAFAETPEGRRREGESDADYTRRSTAGARALMVAANGENLCLNPTLAGPDPYYRTVTAANLSAEGIDLDGQNSTANGRPAPGTCAHNDFRGMNGERGVDNQFYRAVGCLNAFQSTGQSNTFETGMLVGEWGILIELTGIDDVRNDNDVVVTIYANADPIQLSPNREAIPSATYAAEQNPRFTASTHGRIANGVLTTPPFDVRMHKTVNTMWLERFLRDARLRMTLSADGVLEGYMSGYTPTEAMYDIQFGHRTGTDAAGQLIPRMQIVVSNGSSFTQGQSCQGAYQALQQLADGHRDPATGRCTSVSTQYRLRAIPAFIVQTQTRSVNAGLLDSSTSSVGPPSAQRSGY